MPLPVDDHATSDERTYAVFTHLSGAIVAVIGTPGPALLAPLVMWLIKKDQSPFLDDHGREALNFWISMLIYTLLLVPFGFITLGIGWVVGGIALVVLAVVGVISASVAANRGQYYRYPATIRFLK